ncbi:putative ABC transporter, periplasmic substrate-binding protein [Azospirillaceae bacterium]
MAIQFLTALMTASIMTPLTQPVKAEVIHLKADKWCPYLCEPSSPKPGYAIELAKIIFGRRGHEIKYQLMEWKESLEQAREGKINGVVGSSAVQGRGLIYPIEPIGISVNILLTRKGEHFTYNAPQSLQGRLLGVIAGYVYEPELDRYIAAKPEKIQTVSADETALDQLLTLLMSRKLDVVAEDSNVAISKIRELKLNDQVEITHRFDEDPVFIGFSAALPTSTAYAQIWTEGMRAMRSSGELLTILNRYGIPDWR